MTNELRMAVRCHDSHQRPALKRKCSKCIMQQQQNSGVDVTNASRSLSNYQLDPYVPDFGPPDMYHQSYHHAPHSHSSHHHQSSHHLHHSGDNVPSSTEMFRKLGTKSPNYHEARRTPGGTTKPWSTSGATSAITSGNQRAISSVTNHHPAEIHHQYTLYHEESPPTPPPPPSSRQCVYQECEVVDCDPQQRASSVARPTSCSGVNTNNPNAVRNRIGSVNHLNHHLPNGPVMINQENDSQLDNEDEDDVVVEPIDEVDMIVAENDNGFCRQAQHLPLPPPPPALSQASMLGHQMEQSAQPGKSSTMQSKILLNTVPTGTTSSASNRLNGPTIISLNNIGMHQDDYC